MADVRPNILFVMADDHAAHAISAYRSRVNRTPGIDRLAAEGMRLDACFCTNALCSPSRAAILTGTYNHVNGVTSNSSPFDARQPTFVSLLRAAGYQTYLSGKWHLGHGGIHDPVGFDRWSALPGQVVITTRSSWARAASGPRGRATSPTSSPTRPWPGWPSGTARVTSARWSSTRPRTSVGSSTTGTSTVRRRVPEPATLRDDYRGRAMPARAATMRIARTCPRRTSSGSCPWI